jgi:hypothetical protein
LCANIAEKRLDAIQMFWDCPMENSENANGADLANFCVKRKLISDEKKRADVPVLKSKDKRRMIMPGCEKGAATRTLWVCDNQDCGEGYCCTIPSLKPSSPLWCDSPCRFVGTDQCTK